MGWFEWKSNSKVGGKPTNSETFGGFLTSRARIGLALALSFVFIVCLTSLVITTPFAHAADPGHPASSISAGTFESGDFTFPDNLTINKFLKVNGTTLYVDALNGRIGIGTGSPAQELHIFGGNSPKLQIEDSASGTYPGIVLANPDNMWSIQLNSGDIEFKDETSGLSNVLRLDAGTGNVGIGTTTPGANLHIVRGDASQYYLKLERTGTYASAFGFVNRANPNRLDIDTGGGETAVSIVNDTGDIGIGTRSPNYKLEVADVEKALNVSDILFVNGTSGNVGIGTENPWTELHVKGMNQILVVESNGTSGNDKNAGIEIRMSDPSGIGYIDFAPNSSDLSTPDYEGRILVYGNHSVAANNYTMAFYTKAMERLRITGEGDVGIGTTSPERKLDVRGKIQIKISSFPMLILNDSDTKTWNINVNENQGGAFTITEDVTGSARLVVRPGGNVGIGTTNPGTAKLNVSGLIYGSNGLTIESGTVSLPADQIGGTEVDESSLSCSLITGSSDLCDDDDTCSSEACTVGTDDTLSGPSVTANLDMANYLITNIGAAGTDFTSGGGLTLAGNIGITGTGTNTFSGNSNFDGNTLYVNATTDKVGIGTSSPGHKLEIVDSSTVHARVRTTAVDGTAGFAVENDAREWVIRVYGINADSFEIRDVNANAQRLVIDTSGNVGIGTSGPNAKLETKGRIFISDESSIPSGSGAGTVLSYDTTNNRGRIFAYNYTAGSGLQFNLNDLMYIGYGSSGNVGIGTASPNGDLHVNDTSDSRIMFTTSNSGGTSTDGFVLGYQDTATAFIWNYENGPIRFATNNTEKMRLHASGGLSIGDSYDTTDPGADNVIIEGNVGIGTTSPSYKLDVSPGIRIQRSGSSPYILFTRDGNHIGQIRGQASDRISITNTGGNLEFLSVNTTSGNVGIGTTSPQTALHIYKADVSGYGQLALQDTASGASAISYISFYDSGGTRIGFIGDASSANDNIYLGSDTGDIVLWNGNVGIETASPGAKLDIEVTPPYDVLKLTNADTNNPYFFRITSAANEYHLGVGWINSSTGTYYYSIRVYPDTYSNVLVLRDGNVGIGTASPSATLHVVGGDVIFQLG
jgi:hypothetical protein